MAESVKERLARIRAEKAASRGGGTPAPAPEAPAGPSAEQLATAIHVPMNDDEVRAELRAMAEPVTFFAEDRTARRERLRQFKVELARSGGGAGVGSALQQGSCVIEEPAEEFHVEGSDALKEHRTRLTAEGFKRAGARMDRVKAHRSALQSYLEGKFPWMSSTSSEKQPPPSKAEKLEVQRRQQREISTFLDSRTSQLENELQSKLRCSMSVLGVGRDCVAGEGEVRSFVRYFTSISSNSYQSQGTGGDSIVATGSEDGIVTLWNATTGALFAPQVAADDTPSHLPSSPFFVVPSMSRINDLRCSHDRQNGWNSEHSGGLLAAASRDKCVHVWSLPSVDGSSAGKALATLTGHAGPVNRVCFGPRNTVVSTSDDLTWRMWDLNRPDSTEALLVQPGHSRTAARSVHAIAIHPDGSLVTTTDFSGQALTWDVRTGKVAFQLPSTAAHGGQCTSVAWDTFSGWVFATGGSDSLINVWDVRSNAARPLGCVAGHSNTVTQLEFLPYAPSKGTCSLTTFSSLLVSSSLDTTLKYWDLGLVGSSGTSGIGSCVKMLRNQTGVRHFTPLASDGQMDLACVGRERNWYKWELRQAVDMTPQVEGVDSSRGKRRREGQTEDHEGPRVVKTAGTSSMADAVKRATEGATRNQGVGKVVSQAQAVETRDTAGDSDSDDGLGALRR